MKHIFHVHTSHIDVNMVPKNEMKNTSKQLCLSSYEKLVEKSNYIYWRNDFWGLVDQYNCAASKTVTTIIGFDAHSTDQMIKRMDYVKLIK